MRPNQTLPLQATGNPAQPPATLPEALSFAPAPQQQPASQALGLLSALAGLGLNIGSAVQGRGGAAGAASTQFANQQLAQSAENGRESGRVKELESEATSLVKRAKASGISGSALDQITTLAQNRQVAAGRQELDRELSLIRQREREQKVDKELTLKEAMMGLKNLNDTVKSHPGAVDSFLSDFSANLRDDDTPGNIQARLQTEARKAGVRMDSKAAKDYAKELFSAKQEAVSSRKTGGFFGMYQQDVPKENWKSPDKVYQEKLSNPNGVAEFKTLSAQREQLKQATAMLRSKPGSARYQQGRQMLADLQAGEQVAPQQTTQQMAPPPAPKNDAMDQLRAAAKAGDVKAKAYLDSKKIAY